jgi:hypothetical protein
MRVPTLALSGFAGDARTHGGRRFWRVIERIEPDAAGYGPYRATNTWPSTVPTSVVLPS